MAVATNLPRPHEDQRAWFERIVSEHYAFFYATAKRVLRRPEDAEDAVQTGVLKALKRLDQLDEPKAVVSWLARVVHNAALDQARRPKRAVPMGDGLDTVQGCDEPAEPGVAPDQMAILLDEVEQLPTSQAEVVTLRHVEGLAVNELAERLGITPNAARVRLFRAYERLRANPRIRTAVGLES